MSEPLKDCPVESLNAIKTGKLASKLCRDCPNRKPLATMTQARSTLDAVYRRCRVSETKKALSRIAKICRDNIKAFGPTYKPLSRPCNKNSALMYGAKKEGDGVTDACREILTEIKLIRREDRRRKAKLKGESG